MKKMTGLLILAVLCLMITPGSAEAGGSISFSVSYSSGDYFPSYTSYRAYDYYDCQRTGYMIVEPFVRSYSTWYPSYGREIREYYAYPRRVTYYCDGPYVYSPIYSRVIIYDHHYRPVYRYSWDYLGYGYTYNYIGTTINFNYSISTYYADPWRYKPWYKRYSWHDDHRDFGRDYNNRNSRWYDRVYKENRDERRRMDRIDDRFDDRRDRLQLDRQRVDNNRDDDRYRNNLMPESRTNTRSLFDRSSSNDNDRFRDSDRSRSVFERSSSDRNDRGSSVLRRESSSSREKARVESNRASSERLRALQERSASQIRSRSTPSQSRSSSVSPPSSSNRSSSSSVNRSSSSSGASRNRSDSAVSRTRGGERSRSR